MSRYRKLEQRMWADEKFMALTPLQPSGQALWLHLLIGPQTGVIPGLFKANAASLAADLNWPAEALGEALAEALALGMVIADPKARLMYLPNALKFNKPESPNVVTGWRVAWELIPECDLKRLAFDAMKINLHGLSEAFGKAFDEAIVKPKPKPMANQEQEQEQEQEHLKSKAGATTKKLPADETATATATAALTRPKFSAEAVSLPDCIPMATWLLWCAFRSELKKPLGPVAVGQQLADLVEWHAKGADVTAIIKASINGRWAGLFEEKGFTGGFVRKQGPVKAPPGQETMRNLAGLEARGLLDGIRP